MTALFHWGMEGEASAQFLAVIELAIAIKHDGVMDTPKLHPHSRQ